MPPWNLRKQVEYYEQTDLPELSLLRRERPYKMPRGYMDWRWISGALAVGLYMVQEQIYPDLVGSRFAILSSIWSKSNSPIYCLDRNLMRDLQETEILSQRYLLKEIDPAITQFILVFPDNAIRTNAGDNFSFVIIDSINIKRHLIGKESEQLPPLSQRWKEGLEKKYDYMLTWSSIDDSGAVWYSGRGLDSEGRLISSNEQISRHKLDAGDRDFIEVIENLIFNVLLLLTYEPEVVTEYRERSKGFHKPNPQHKDKFWHPRWLQESTIIKTRYAYTSLPTTGAEGAKRASPHPHVRKSHWKRVPCGKGRTDRKWVRIRQVSVLA